MQNTYLLISPDDFYAIQRKWPYDDRFAFIESVLKYLERHDIPHMHCYDSIRIYPTDHFHAREICEHFRITEVRYFINGKPSKLFETKKRIDSFYYTPHWMSFDLIANKWFKSLLKSTPRSIQKEEKQTTPHPAQTSFQIQKPFIGNFIDFKPKLWLFWPIECAVQGSFLR